MKHQHVNFKGRHLGPAIQESGKGECQKRRGNIMSVSNSFSIPHVQFVCFERVSTVTWLSVDLKRASKQWPDHFFASLTLTIPTGTLKIGACIEQLLAHIWLTLSRKMPHPHFKTNTMMEISILPSQGSAPKKGSTVCPIAACHILMSYLSWHKMITFIA